MMAQDVEVASSFQPLLGLAANFLGSHESQVADPMIEARVPMKRVCSICHRQLQPRQEDTGVVITDLVFTKSGCRKAVIQYSGKKGWCFKCSRVYKPNVISSFERRNFGHNFISWVVYQR